MNPTGEKENSEQLPNQIYIKNEKYPREEDNDDCWASDSGSSSGSYYSSSISSAIDWEVTPSGEVFHVESPIDIQTFNNDVKVSDNDYLSPAPEQLTRRRSTRGGKLMRLLRRRESSRRKFNISSAPHRHTANEQHRDLKKNTCDKNITGDKCLVNIWVNPDKRHRLGRRATLCEAYLGILPNYSSDKVLVAKFLPDGEQLKRQAVQVGDWLQSVNSNDVNPHNLDEILSTITFPMTVNLLFQKRCDSSNVDNFVALNCPNQSLLVRQLVDMEESKILMDSLVREPLGVIYLKMGEITETENDVQGIIYHFPKSKNKKTQSLVMTIKGAFITLCHMLPGITGPQPVSTTINTPSGCLHTIYSFDKQEVLLIYLPEKCCSKQEALCLVEDMVRCLDFTHENLSKCFNDESNHSYLDHMFYIFFSRLLQDKSKASKNIVDIRQCDFNFLLPGAQSMYMPRDAQIHIDAALSEMEAMDYRDWNEMPLECQRLYTILGSCLYHKKYLIGSHLMHQDLIQVHSFLRRHGIFNLINAEMVKSLVIWKKIFPASRRNLRLNQVQKDVNDDYTGYLLVVGYGHNILAVIMECGGCTAIHEKEEGPDLFYVEEAQETLKHLRKIGIPTLAEKWISANAKPEIVPFQKESSSKVPANITDNILNLIKSSENSPVPTRPNSNIQHFARPYENISMSYIAKQRSLESSQDSLSQGTVAVSEISDEAMPILGRRATREKAALQAQWSDESDSDFEADHQSGILDIRENLLNRSECIVPQIITAGEKNTLIFYVHLDLCEGILFTSDLGALKDSSFISSFNNCAQQIRKLFNDSVKYKKMLDIGKSGVNKSLIAVKEYGVLYEWENTNFWIVGRLCTIPKYKEFYVCYYDGVPQNLLEMAFRLESMNH